MRNGDQAERLEPDSGEEEGAWYFDLPAGAWERQEQKNKDLRQSVRRNIDAGAAPPSPFGARGRAAGQSSPGGWRLARPGEEDEQPEGEPGPQFTFDPLEPRAAHSAMPPAPPARSWMVDDDDGPDPSPPRVAGVEEHAEPPAGGRRALAAAGEDTVGGQDGDVLGGLRAWATQRGGRRESFHDARVRLDAPAPAADAPPPAADAPPPPRVIPLRPGALASAPPPDVEGEEPSKWDEAFSASTDDVAIVASMKEWAHRKAAIEDARRRQQAGEDVAVPPEFLVPFDWEDGPPAVAPGVHPAGERHEDLVAEPADGPSGPHAASPDSTSHRVVLEGPDWPAPAPGAARGAAWPEHGAANLDGAEAETALDAEWPAIFGVAETPAPEATRRPGLLGRLFGRKQPKPEVPAMDSGASPWTFALDEGPALPVAESSAWAFATPVATDEPAPAVVPAYEPAPDAEARVDDPRRDDENADSPVDPPAEIFPWPRNHGGFDAHPPAELPHNREGSLTEALRTEAAGANNGDMPSFHEEPAAGPEPRSPLPGAPPDPGDPWAEFLAAQAATAAEPANTAPLAAPAPGAWGSSEDDVPATRGVAGFRGDPAGAAGPGLHETAAEPSTGIPVDAGDRAMANQLDGGRGGSHWDDFQMFEEGAGLPEAQAAPPVPPAPAALAADVPPDDPWGEIAGVSGYGASPEADTGVFRRKAAFGQQAADPAPAPATAPWQEAWAAHRDPHASEISGWHDGETGSGDDPVLRAFESHASDEDDNPGAGGGATVSPQAVAHPDPGFEPLLGREGADLVDEVSPPPLAHPSFARLQGWAPQKPATEERTWAPPVLPFAPRPPEDRWVDDDEVATAPPWGAPPVAADDGREPPLTAVAAGHTRGRTVVREIVETGLLALLVFLSVRASFQNFKVDGSSMYPTLENGQFLIVNKLVYSEIDVDRLSKFVPFIDPGDTPRRNVFHGPERGDIVVLRDPRKADTDLIKRVIGLPGETIEIVNGVVYINDHKLEEPYIKSPWHYTGPKIMIEPGKYFVMGDNRENSLDSRTSSVGLIDKELIIGKAMVSYWPSEKFGLAPNGSPRVTAELIGTKAALTPTGR